MNSRQKPLINELIDAFCCLPGVGNKSAQRLALHLLERDRSGAKHLARIIDEAMEKIGNCQRCHTFAEIELCEICADSKRVDDVICVVETPADVFAIEHSASFAGKYFVLMGHLSPLDGIGANDIGLDKLYEILEEGKVKELILATNPTIEGEATAEYIRNIAEPLNILVTRIAHGVPIGGELGYMDQGTLAHALNDRKPFQV